MVTRLRSAPRIALVVFAAACLTGASGPAASATAPPCAPSRLNTSAERAGGAVTVSPAPGTLDASYLTQISFLGAPGVRVGHVLVAGSRSGGHPGRLLTYSQGDGASFVPAKPFAQGEVVTVHAVAEEAGAAPRPFSWRFTIAQVDGVSRSLETPPPPPPPLAAGETQRFVSRPDLQPPAVTVTTDSGGQGPGDLFLAPYAGPGQYGPMILDPHGGLVWFKRLAPGARAADLRAQEYGGRAVLTWWEDPLVAQGRRDAGIAIADGSYRTVQIVRAGNGYQPDLHAFEITPQGTALFTVYDAIRCDLSRQGGPAEGAVADTVFQEVDLRSGLVRFEWHALDHVALADSYQPVGAGSPRSPWDWFHINAVAAQGTTVLVDSRNTWAAYDVDRRSGQTLWRLGGKESSFAMGPGAAPAWQHDARAGANGTITFFDNGGTPKVHSQSRVIVVALDTAAMTAKLISSFTHLKPLLAASQGDFQPLGGGGEWMVGWGQEPFFSEFSGTGQLLFDAHLPASYQSYTVFKYPWAGTPAERPRVGVRAGGHGALTVYASWNGATGVSGWRVLGGSSSRSLATVATVARSGFETPIGLRSTPRYVAVQALGAHGELLSSSLPVRGASG